MSTILGVNEMQMSCCHYEGQLDLVLLLSTYTALRLSQICGGLGQTRKTPTLVNIQNMLSTLAATTFCYFSK
jgi:hypothetical protein